MGRFLRLLRKIFNMRGFTSPLNKDPGVTCTMANQKKTLESLFKDPPNEFRHMPFWFWNHEMVEKEVVRQINDHHEHGIGGEFIHPRHGRLTPYMGKRWLENVEAAADECKRLNMPCYLYDEDNWPSGPAGGYITGPYRPENRGKFLAMFDEDVFEGPCKVNYKLDYQQISPETTFYAAIAVPEPEHYPDFSGVVSMWQDVSEHVKDGIFTWDVPEGSWCVLFFCILINPHDANLNGYIDILRRETVREFIEFTHERYVDYFIEQGKKDYIGDVIPGIFTDEPSMAHMQAPAGNFINWMTFTPEMPDRFREMHGYDFNEILASMVYDTGEISAKHRCDYWETTVAMYVDAFYKQIYDYCEQHGLKTTGHVNAEGSFPSHIKNHGDFFKVFEFMHFGGCDQLTEQVRPDGIEHFWNVTTNPYTGMAMDMITASKLASSAAHLLGKPRVLVESWGTSSWDITMASAKRVNDYLIATGCDLFVPHSFNISEDSYRKGDHPAAFNYQPYYKHWKLLADHTARLCAILNADSGTMIPEVLFLYPSKTFHAEHPCQPTSLLYTICEYFIHATDCLYRQQVDFEFANEEMITGGQINGNEIVINSIPFKVLYLGATTCMPLEFARFVEEFYNAGGKIIATLALPWKDPAKGESEEICTIFKNIFNMDPMALAGGEGASTGNTFKIHESVNDAGGHAVFIPGAREAPWHGGFFPAFQEAINKVIPMDARDTCLWKDQDDGQEHPAYIMATHKSIDGKDYYFLANTSKDIEYKNVEVILNVVAAGVDIWDTLTGEITPVKGYDIENGKTFLHLDFPKYKSYLVVVTPPGGQASIGERVSRPGKSLSMEDPLETINLGRQFTLDVKDPNCAMLYLDWHSSYEANAGKAWGYKSIRTFSHDFNIQEKDAINQVKLVIEGLVGDYGWAKSTTDPLVGGDRAHFTIPSCVKVSVNGKLVNLKFDFEVEYLDAYWIVADITKHLQEGKNTVMMACRTSNHQTFHVVTDPWRLIGDFEVEEAAAIPMLKPVRKKINLGPLGEQGFPRYHGGIGYTKEISIPARAVGKRVVLSMNGTTDCVEVHVNGNLLGVCWNRWDI
ncbi:hypothetical protein GF325_00395, partial [Candidatus Bathyarchaeota archaeon]|nr:hypothetical protein [Candidatus Bathyarchaeota archaeon]